MDAMAPSFYTAAEAETVGGIFPTCENISIDYAIMEKVDEIFVFPANFGWSDLGTWVSLHNNVAKDINGNASLGIAAKFADSHNCVVNARGMKSVVVIGVEDCIVAEKDGNLLVCKMSQENRIKEFSEEN